MGVMLTLRNAKICWHMRSVGEQVFAGGLKQVKPSPTEEISRRSERRGAVQGTLL